MDVHPTKNVSIGIDPYPCLKWNAANASCAARTARLWTCSQVEYALSWRQRQSFGWLEVLCYRKPWFSTQKMQGSYVFLFPYIIEVCLCLSENWGQNHTKSKCSHALSFFNDHRLEYVPFVEIPFSPLPIFTSMTPAFRCSKPCSPASPACTSSETAKSRSGILSALESHHARARPLRLGIQWYKRCQLKSSWWQDLYFIYINIWLYMRVS